MGDFLKFQPGAWFLGDMVWQSTLLLGLGLVASGLLARRAARRTGACCWPFLPRSSRPFCEGARLGGWGILTGVEER